MSSAAARVAVADGAVWVVGRVAEGVRFQGAEDAQRGERGGLPGRQGIEKVVGG